MADEKHEYGKGLAAMLAWRERAEALAPLRHEPTIAEASAIRSALEAEARVPEMLRERDETIARLAHEAHSADYNVGKAILAVSAAESRGFARGVEAAAKEAARYTPHGSDVPNRIRSLAPAAQAARGVSATAMVGVCVNCGRGPGVATTPDGQCRGCARAGLPLPDLAPAAVDVLTRCGTGGVDCLCVAGARCGCPFAYGNAKLSNPDVTREMAEQAYDRMHPPAAVGEGSVAKAVAEEREACARVAEAGIRDEWSPSGIADRIRSRTRKESGCG